MYKIGDRVIALLKPTGAKNYLPIFVGKVIKSNEWAVLVRWPDDPRIGVKQTWMINSEVRPATDEEIKNAIPMNN